MHTICKEKCLKNVVLELDEILDIYEWIYEYFWLLIFLHLLFKTIIKILIITDLRLKNSCQKLVSNSRIKAFLYAEHNFDSDLV